MRNDRRAVIKVGNGLLPRRSLAQSLSFGLLLSTCLLTACQSESESSHNAQVSDSAQNQELSQNADQSMAKSMVAAPVFEGTMKPPAAVTLTRSVSQHSADGDDLLSAGLGLVGIAGSAPATSQPPTAAELRKLALYNGYRALVDLSPSGDFVNGKRSDGQAHLAPIAGTEVLALRQLQALKQASAVLLQIPESFDWEQPCLVAAATSGSRGIYGAVPVIAHWSLARGCATVYTEKGTGNGIYIAEGDWGYSLTGELTSVAQAAFDPLNDEDIAEAQWERYVEDHPQRIAFRHAHSTDNPEAHWGEFVIDAVYFALAELNVRRPQGADELHQDNTLIIAAGISNGGGSAIAAVEQDDVGLFDGVAVSEPNVNVPGAPSLYASSTAANLYASCAVQALDPSSHPLAALLAFQTPLFQQRCDHLAQAGMLDAAKGELAQQALEKMHAAGYPASSDPLLAFAVIYDIYPAIAATYASSYGRFPFYEPPCEVGFALTTLAGEGQSMGEKQAETLFASSGGLAPTANIQLVKTNIHSQEQPGKEQKAALVPGFGEKADGDLAAALCHHEFNTADSAKAARVREGIAAIQTTGKLRGRPSYIVHGAADNIVPVEHSSRAYVALNKKVEGEHSRLNYVEVENGQHFDALMALPPYAARYEALHPHYIKALDQLWNDLHKSAEGS
ncbi:MAG: D-(-)-3-hydroxybutyrate oligomer hydrolase [Xanthomonadales bacterium]|nr:D-(-)-3-hydroxybutyrate oligomer hydrolase [Xanthomonadales bacterium]